MSEGFEIPCIDYEQVRLLRSKGLSLQKARSVAVSQNIRIGIERSKDISDIKECLLHILDAMYDGEL